VEEGGGGERERAATVIEGERRCSFSSSGGWKWQNRRMDKFYIKVTEENLDRFW